METKKIVVNGFVFLLVFVLIYILLMLSICKIKVGKIPLIYFTSKIYCWKGGNSYQKFNEFKKDDKYDIIVIGSSHAAKSYDPRIFKTQGLKLFSLGTFTQSPLNTYYIAKNYITPNNCKLLILDVYDGVMHIDGYESTCDLIQNISSDKAAIEMAEAYTDPQVLNLLTLRILSKNRMPIYYDSLYIKSGYSEKKDSLKAPLPIQEYQNENKPNLKQIEYLEKTILYFKSNNIKIVMVTIPFPKEKFKSQHQIFYEKYNLLAQKYGIPYFDYSFNHQLNSLTDFYDSHHLNQNGVNIFNKQLLSDLDKVINLTNN